MKNSDLYISPYKRKKNKEPGQFVFFMFDLLFGFMFVILIWRILA